MYYLLNLHNPLMSSVVESCPISQIKKLRLREIKCRHHGHTVRQQQLWELNQDLCHQKLTSEVVDCHAQPMAWRCVNMVLKSQWSCVHIFSYRLIINQMHINQGKTQILLSKLHYHDSKNASLFKKQKTGVCEGVDHQNFPSIYDCTLHSHMSECEIGMWVGNQSLESDVGLLTATSWNMKTIYHKD